MNLRINIFIAIIFYLGFSSCKSPALFQKTASSKLVFGLVDSFDSLDLKTGDLMMFQSLTRDGIFTQKGTLSRNGQSKGCGFTTIWTSKTNKPFSNPNDPARTIEKVEKETATTSPPSTTGQGNEKGSVIKTGILYGKVFTTKEEAGKNNPYELEGVPKPDINVIISYSLNGKTITNSATTDASGKFRFTGLPLNVVIAVTSSGLTLKRELTTSGRQYVQFGWDGEIEIKQNK